MQPIAGTHTLTKTTTKVTKVSKAETEENLQETRRASHQPQNDFPGAGRLKLCAQAWRKVTQNNVILNIITHGLKIQFHTIPKIRTLPPSSFSKTRTEAINIEILELLDESAIKEISPSPNQFLSPIFDVPKKDSLNRRIILNLKILNSYIVKTKFKLEGFNFISSLICKGDFLVSIDLKDAYLMFSMHEEVFDFLCFDWLGTRYCYICMPFGLTSAPRIFTKVLKAVLTFLRSRGIKASAWFDDIILSAKSISLLLEQLYFTKLLLKSLGFIINREKKLPLPFPENVSFGLYMGYCSLHSFSSRRQSFKS